MQVQYLYRSIKFITIARIYAGMEKKMIIELLKIEGPKDIFLVHYDLKKDRFDHLKKVVDWLGKIPAHAVLEVPNGQPAPSNPSPKITIYNADNDVLLGAMQKIISNLKPGAVIALTAEEMKAVVNSKATDWTQL